MHPWVKAGKRTESGRKAPRPSVDVATYPRRQVGRGTWDAHDDDWERGLSDVLDLRMGGRSGNRRHRGACHGGAGKRISINITGKGRTWTRILHDGVVRAELPGEGQSMGQFPGQHGDFA